MRPVSLTPALLSVLLLTACASEQLASSAPQGVNLSGEWNFDPNLSDDPNKLGGGETDKARPQQRSPGGHRGPGGRGGGVIPPIGGPGGGGGGGYNYLPLALTDQDTGPLPAQPTSDAAPTRGAADSGPSRGRGPNSGGRSLRSPTHLSITQNDNSIVIHANMTDGSQLVEEYKPGTVATINYGGDNTAKRTVGWRGAVLVVNTEAKKGGTREDDFALDDEGHLIMTTETKGGHQGNGEIKRVFDRVRASATQN